MKLSELVAFRNNLRTMSTRQVNLNTASEIKKIIYTIKELPFDDSEMEATVVDQKIDNLLGVLGWDLASATNTENTFQNLFEW
jgi:hypothetical protein